MFRVWEAAGETASTNPLFGYGAPVLTYKLVCFPVDGLGNDAESPVAEDPAMLKPFHCYTSGHGRDGTGNVS